MKRERKLGKLHLQKETIRSTILDWIAKGQPDGQPGLKAILEMSGPGLNHNFKSMLLEGLIKRVHKGKYILSEHTRHRLEPIITEQMALPPPCRLCFN